MLASQAEQQALERECDRAVSQLRDLARALEDAKADDDYVVGVVVGIIRGAIGALETIDWKRPVKSGGER